MTIWGSVVDFPEGGSSEWPAQAAFKCDGCGRLSITTGQRVKSPWSGTEQATFYVGGASDWLPLSTSSKSYSDVPNAIADVAMEAHRCLSIGAHRAVVALARAVVEGTAKSKGITKGSLQQKIEELHSQLLIREHIKDAAHEVRFEGNEVAHGDLVDEPIGGAAATEILGLMDEILEEVFESPARVARRRQQRLEKERLAEAKKSLRPEAATKPVDAGQPQQWSDEPPF